MNQLYVQAIAAIEAYLYAYDSDEVAGSEVERMVHDITDQLNDARRVIEAAVKVLGA